MMLSRHVAAAIVLGVGLYSAATAAAHDPCVSAFQPPTPGMSAQDARESLRIERFHWSKDVGGATPIRALEVVNDYGDIRARLAEEPTAEAFATIQRLDRGPHGIGVTVERRGSVVALTVTYPPGRQQDADPSPPKDRMDRLDLTLFVPAGVAVSARTIRGMVEARGLESDVTATTLGGDISVITTGAVQARTAEGQVSVVLRPGRGERPIVLESRSGPLSLTVPQNADLEIRAETAGAVATDLAIKRVKLGDRTRLLGTLGRGSRDVLIYSDTGGIDVRRAQP